MRKAQHANPMPLLRARPRVAPISLPPLRLASTTAHTTPAPLSLYRRLLRAHRTHLPPAQRTLGDAYARAEFRAHREVRDAGVREGFLREWRGYVRGVEVGVWRTPRGGGEGGPPRGGSGVELGRLSGGFFCCFAFEGFGGGLTSCGGR